MTQVNKEQKLAVVEQVRGRNLYDFVEQLIKLLAPESGWAIKRAGVSPLYPEVYLERSSKQVEKEVATQKVVDVKVETPTTTKVDETPVVTKKSTTAKTTKKATDGE